MLIGFCVADSLELNIPEDSSITLLTASCHFPATIFLELRHEKRFMAAMLRAENTASLQYPLTHRDNPVMIIVDSPCHFVATTIGFETLDSLMIKENKCEALDPPATDEVVELQTKIQKSRKRRLRRDDSNAEEPIEEPSKIYEAVGKETTSEETEALPSIVVATPRPDSAKRRRWKVRPASEDVGVLVPSPKQVIKGSGVVITDYVVGKMKVPKLGSKVKVIYQAMFPDGKVFDEHLSTKQPFVFRLGAAQVIRGLDLGMEGMRIGGAREIVIPPELG